MNHDEVPVTILAVCQDLGITLDDKFTILTEDLHQTAVDKPVAMPYKKTTALFSMTALYTLRCGTRYLVVPMHMAYEFDRVKNAESLLHTHQSQQYKRAKEMTVQALVEHLTDDYSTFHEDCQTFERYLTNPDWSGIKGYVTEAVLRQLRWQYYRWEEQCYLFEELVSIAGIAKLQEAERS